MNCLHPRKKKVINPLTGEERVITYPCGECVNCLHAQQDSWRIRLEATTAAYGSVIYDTLTIRPEAMGYNDVYEELNPSEYELFRVKSDVFRKVDNQCWKWLIKHDWKIPFYEKTEVMKWLKRGREAFKRHYGARCDMKYWIVEEYGPQTTRPHFHCLFWGISYKDYMRFFGNQWKQDYGWTKPTYIACNGKDAKTSLRKISAYVSKYVTKGQFENPLVQAGLMERPYRLISKGIGAELLGKDFFKEFLRPEVQALAKYTAEKYGVKEKEDAKSFCKYLDVPTPTVEEDAESRDFNNSKPVCAAPFGAPQGNVDVFWLQQKLEEIKRCKPEYLDEVKPDINSVLFLLELEGHEDAVKTFQNLCQGILPSGQQITDKDIKRLALFYDDAGYPHAMPRYYRDKITKGHEYNLLAYAISTLLQQSALVQYNKGLQAQAAIMGIRIPDEYLGLDSSLWGLSESDLFMVTYQYFIAERIQASAKAKRRYTRLKNHYQRSEFNENAPALL